MFYNSKNKLLKESVPRVLFITSSIEDYLADGVMRGLRTILGSSLIDYPKAEHLYESFAHKVQKKIRGHGFTLYTSPLKDIDIDRSQIDSRLESGEFDLVIFGCIEKQYQSFLHFLKWLNPKNTVILDGADYDDAMPYLRSDPLGRWSGLIPPTSRFTYYKREYTKNTQFNLLTKLLCKLGWRWNNSPPNIRQISFCIPDEKISLNIPIKTKLLPSHIVDDELRNFLGRNDDGRYTFDTESDYYADMAASRYGITMKRGGWDCLRHYEIVLNHAIPCFRNLNEKPMSCAPHGLNEANCIIYSSAQQLMEIYESLNESDYTQMQTAGQKWIMKQTSSVRATELLNGLL